MTRLLYEIGTSWFSTLAVIAFGVVFGGSIVLVAGSVEGWLDEVLMRFTDVLLALPCPVLAIAVVATLGPSRPVGDFPAIAGVTLVLGLSHVLINALVDVLQRVADPRVRI